VIHALPWARSLKEDGIPMKELLSKRSLAVILAVLMSAMMLMAAPAQAFADDVIVAQSPQGASYYLNEVPDDLVAIFNLSETGNDGWQINPDQPIAIQWFISDDNESYTELGGRQEIPYAGYTNYQVSYTPPTDTVGVKYYYVTIYFTMSDGQNSLPSFRSSDSARIEVREEPEFSAELRVPFTKTVEQGGTAAPGEATFYLQAAFADMPDQGDGWDADGYFVTTNGAGNYDGEIVITITNPDVLEMFILQGMVVLENSGDPLADWEYSDAMWYVTFERTGDGVILVYIQEVTEIVEQQPVLGEFVDVMAFTNVYTADAPVAPSTPQTGDSSIAAIGLAAICSVVGAGALGLSRRRRPVETE